MVVEWLVAEVGSVCLSEEMKNMKYRRWVVSGVDWSCRISAICILGSMTGHENSGGVVC